ncbi:MAG: prepilin-type N-terminal cleavage/methylation domain-containing protein [Gemmatimonadota bacterium]
MVGRPESREVSGRSHAGKRPGRRRGFSLIEALVALTLGAVVMGLVMSVFVAQNRFYRHTVVQSQVQDHVRMVTEIITQEFRQVTRGGVLTAQPRELVVRVPLAVGMVCDLVDPVTKGKGGKGKVSTPGSASIYFPLEGDTVEGARVSGYAVREVDGSWTYSSSTWDALSPSSAPTNVCGVMGGWVGGDAGNYLSLSGGVPGVAEPGELLGLFEEVEFFLDDSELAPGSQAVFRRRAGASATEIATGVTDEAGFQYRMVNGTLQDDVTGLGNLSQVVGIRFTAGSTSQSVGGVPGVEPFEYGWVVDVPLRNLN